MRSGIGNSASDPIFVSSVGGAGAQPAASSQSVTPSSDGFAVKRAQNTPSRSIIALTANTTAQLVAADSTLNGCSLRNYGSAPVRVALGTSGDPDANYPMDIIPAASNGLPGQLEPGFAPTTGLRGQTAGSGVNVTVTVW